MALQVQTFLAAIRALSRREVQYGSYATSEEVSARLILRVYYGSWFCTGEHGIFFGCFTVYLLSFPPNSTRMW